MKIDFVKMHGTGNDFVVFNNIEYGIKRFRPELIQFMCDRRLGIGADGVLALEKSSKADFRMRYFNSDGYESDMCANGSRCIGYFAYENKIVKNKYNFEAGDGIHQATVKSMDEVEVQVLKQDIDSGRSFPGDFNLPEGITYKNFLNTGVPHLILEAREPEKVNVDELGRSLRFHKYYSPEGTNVNFVSIAEANRQKCLHVRTFERGVDNETLSCGSGVTACAVAYKPEFQSDEIPIRTSGGMLKVKFNRDSKDIFLAGPVKIVYYGHLLIKGDLL